MNTGLKLQYCADREWAARLASSHTHVPQTHPRNKLLPDLFVTIWALNVWSLVRNRNEVRVNIFPNMMLHNHLSEIFIGVKMQCNLYFITVSIYRCALVCLSWWYSRLSTVLSPVNTSTHSAQLCLWTWIEWIGSVHRERCPSISTGLYRYVVSTGRICLWEACGGEIKPKKSSSGLVRR